MGATEEERTATEEIPTGTGAAKKAKKTRKGPDGKIIVQVDSLANQANVGFNEDATLEFISSSCEMKGTKQTPFHTLTVTKSKDVSGKATITWNGGCVEGAHIIADGVNLKICGKEADSKAGTPAEYFSAKNATLENIHTLHYVDISGGELIGGRTIAILSTCVFRYNNSFFLSKYVPNFLAFGKKKEIINDLKALDGVVYDEKTKFHLSEDQLKDTFEALIVNGQIDKKMFTMLKNNRELAEQIRIGNQKLSEYDNFEELKTALSQNNVVIESSEKFKNALKSFSQTQEFKDWGKKFNEDFNKQVHKFLKKFSHKVEDPGTALSIDDLLKRLKDNDTLGELIGDDIDPKFNPAKDLIRKKAGKRLPDNAEFSMFIDRDTGKRVMIAKRSNSDKYGYICEIKEDSTEYFTFEKAQKVTTDVLFRNITENTPFGSKSTFRKIDINSSNIDEFYNKLKELGNLTDGKQEALEAAEKEYGIDRGRLNIIAEYTKIKSKDEFKSQFEEITKDTPMDSLVTEIFLKTFNDTYNNEAEKKLALKKLRLDKDQTIEGQIDSLSRSKLHKKFFNSLLSGKNTEESFNLAVSESE